MNKKEEYIIFCLEAYKKYRHISGDEAFCLFKKFNVFAYLIDGYEVLHTQGLDFVTSEIDDYIINRS